MKTTMPVEYVAGQKMILVKSGKDLLVVPIVRLTKTQILVNDPGRAPDQVLRFEKLGCMRRGGSKFYLPSHELVGRDRYTVAILYDHSDEAMTKLFEWREEQKQVQQKKKEAEEKRQQEAAEHHAKGLQEVKRLCGDGDLSSVTQLIARQPDGTRIYALDVPVRAEYFARKEGWETAIVVCKDKQEEDWEKWRQWREEHRNEEVTKESTECGRQACMTRVVKYSYTWVNGGQGSFSSCSQERCLTDEEVLWKVLRYIHFNW